MTTRILVERDVEIVSPLRRIEGVFLDAQGLQVAMQRGQGRAQVMRNIGHDIPL